VNYWVQCLNGAGSSKVDGLILHTYTHGCSPGLVTTESMMGTTCGYQIYHSEFRVYKDYMNNIPSGFTTKPVLITETDENIECNQGGNEPHYTWYNASNNGWVKAAYAESTVGTLPTPRRSAV